MKHVQALPLKLQQHVNIHFCVKLGWTFNEIKHGLQVCYNQDMLADHSIHQWIS